MCKFRYTLDMNREVKAKKSTSYFLYILIGALLIFFAVYYIRVYRSPEACAKRAINTYMESAKDQAAKDILRSVINRCLT